MWNYFATQWFLFSQLAQEALRVCVFMTVKGALPKLVAAQYVITVWINIFQNKTSILVSHVRHAPL